jgi:DUF4097 and DUF4098 domain-containing protein YvlB
MNPRWTPIAAATLAATLFLPVSAPAAEWTVLEDSESCDDRGRDDDWCEVREIVLPARDLVSVDAGRNGGIQVEAWDKNEIRLRAMILVHDVRGEDPEEIAANIRIDTEGTIAAKGPEGRDKKWAVSYRLMVPARSNLELEANNGGIGISGVEGTLEFSTLNGGISLANVAGDVRGRTTNGGITVDLDGASWKGEGLDLETTNGGIELAVPDGYSARLQMATVNGGVHSDFEGEGDRDERGRPGRPKRIALTLGDGGALLRLVTTNGGIHVEET